MEPINREILHAELSRDEGNKLKAYRDSRGFWTIGTGRNLDARRGGPTGPYGISASETATLFITRASCLAKGITDAQRIALLDNDIDNCLRDLDRALPWWRKLDGVRQRVLVNMCFNMGVSKLLGFKNTLAAIENGRWADAANGMLSSAWATQVHDRATRLASLMLLGERHL